MRNYTGEEKLVTITFEPDHENHSFEDVLQIQVKSEVGTTFVVIVLVVITITQIELQKKYIIERKLYGDSWSVYPRQR